MNPEVKTLWLEALRSGEYSQAKEQLATSEGHCCLGVLCEVAIKQGVIQYYDPEGSGLPRVIQEWADLEELPSGEWDSDAESYTYELAVKNDSGASFAEIADLIEQDF